jgi:nucleoside-diphosphate-sugar epimerase
LGTQIVDFLRVFHGYLARIHESGHFAPCQPPEIQETMPAKLSQAPKNMTPSPDKPAVKQTSTPATVLKGTKILVTGATGSVGFPIALALAEHNQVTAAARFSDPKKQAQLQKANISCVSVDFSTGDFSVLAQNFDYVLHFAVSRISDDDFENELISNAEATGLLMAHCRNAKAFLHCSSCAVYHPNGREPLTETSPLGDNHRTMFPTYSVGKNAAEAVARFAARAYQLPTIIARLNVPYGNTILGWPFYHLMMMQHSMPIPVHTDKPSEYCLIHEDDIFGSIPALLAAASTPATIVNWSSAEPVSVEQWCSFIAEQTGLTASFDYGENNLQSVVSDNSRFTAIAGATNVNWQDGIKQLLTTHHKPKQPHPS